MLTNPKLEKVIEDIKAGKLKRIDINYVDLIDHDDLDTMTEYDSDVCLTVVEYIQYQENVNTPVVRTVLVHDSMDNALVVFDLDKEIVVIRDDSNKEVVYERTLDHLPEAPTGVEVAMLLKEVPAYTMIHIEYMGTDGKPVIDSLNKMDVLSFPESGFIGGSYRRPSVQIFDTNVPLSKVSNIKWLEPTGNGTKTVELQQLGEHSSWTLKIT